MKIARLISKLPLLLLLFSPLLCGADLSTYRGFQFGMSLLLFHVSVPKAR